MEDTGKEYDVSACATFLLPRSATDKRSALLQVVVWPSQTLQMQVLYAFTYFKQLFEAVPAHSA